MTIFITKIDFFEDERDVIDIWPDSSAIANSALYDSADKRVDEEVVIELLHGVEFVRPDGTRVTVGYSKQVQEVLGIGYDVIGSIQTEMGELHRIITRQQQHIDERDIALHNINRWSWWERLKRVFTGNGDITI